MSTILVVSEIRDNQLKSINFEIFNASKKLAEKTNLNLIALLIGANVNQLGKVPGKYGISQTIVIEDTKLDRDSPDCYTAAISEIARQKDAKIILMGATNMGKDLMKKTS